jgi:hypothetical protein
VSAPSPAAKPPRVGDVVKWSGCSWVVTEAGRRLRLERLEGLERRHAWLDPEELHHPSEPPAAAPTVDHPRHYNAHPSGVECIVVAEAFGFNIGNVIKYVWRADEKGGSIEDLKKARWYLDREIARRDAARASGSATGGEVAP